MVSSRFSPADAAQRSDSASPHRIEPSSPTGSPPWILDTLFRNLSYDLEQVADVIDPILTAQNHCHRTTWYVQGITAAGGAFLSTNINCDRTIQVTLCGTRWLLGQSQRCTVAMAEPGIADCHAALNFDVERGFFLTDLGSRLGTWVNGRRLVPSQRHYLQDGDLVKLGSLRFEFLQQRCDRPVWNDAAWHDD
ncbi:MAG TPA: FHA domain-containing protein [Nodosilinea sp.]|nr:FHA domain-containing protein [Nodosilinea sp.]